MPVEPALAPDPRSGSAPVSDAREDGPTLSVVVCAYNEEQNIGRLVKALLASRGAFALVEVICVASGCTDGTVSILNSLEEGDPRLKVVVQPNREGKAEALSLGLQQARGEIILVENADTLPAEGCLNTLVSRFEDPSVRLVCVRPLPVSRSSGWSSRLARAMWSIHDQVCTVAPNAGEAYALRSPGFRIPPDVYDDDTYVCFRAREGGGRVVYARDAVVYNRPPETLSELTRQRFRIHEQAARLKRAHGYRTSTKSASRALPAVGRTLRSRAVPARDVVAFVALEIAVVLVATVASFRRRDLRRWQPIASTKGPVQGGAQLP
jgi:poly-beta-1,6-N-acetyl-D-glucosamine synthase